MADQTDEQLLDPTQPTGEQRFTELIRRHGRYVYGVAKALVGDEHEAEDVVQETFVAAWKGRGNYRGDASVRTWLVSIAVRQAAMNRRKRKPWLRLWRTAADGDERDTGLDSQPGKESAPSDQADARMDLGRMLAILSPEHRQVIVLRELEHLSYEQMAEILKVPRGTVESRLNRARNQLKERFGKTD